eukprot:TRINITY_DN35830_c0_g1_i1.p1 TRINITY_DN35830_c0_g1~~TRINITY_DN35830_c0_g1_i1.p1  ORF type:complete len:109 (+),score=8.71 TRINITY_DN35830_c0_g1_i1:118-444(+)
MLSQCGLLAVYPFEDWQPVEVRGTSQKPEVCSGRGTTSERRHARHLRHLAERRCASLPKFFVPDQIAEQEADISLVLREIAGTESRCSLSLAVLSRSLSAPGELGEAR